MTKPTEAVEYMMENRTRTRLTKTTATQLVATKMDHTLPQTLPWKIAKALAGQTNVHAQFLSSARDLAQEITYSLHKVRGAMDDKREKMELYDFEGHLMENEAEVQEDLTSLARKALNRVELHHGLHLTLKETTKEARVKNAMTALKTLSDLQTTQDGEFTELRAWMTEQVSEAE